VSLHLDQRRICSAYRFAFNQVKNDGSVAVSATLPSGASDLAAAVTKSIDGAQPSLDKVAGDLSASAQGDVAGAEKALGDVSAGVSGSVGGVQASLDKIAGDVSSAAQGVVAGADKALADASASVSKSLDSAAASIAPPSVSANAQPGQIATGVVGGIAAGAAITAAVSEASFLDRGIIFVCSRSYLDPGQEPECSGHSERSAPQRSSFARQGHC
jgi:hypothetical protein